MVWLDRSIYTVIDTYSSLIFVLSRCLALRFWPRFLEDNLIFIVVFLAISICTTTNTSLFLTLVSDEILVFFLSDTSLQCLVFVQTYALLCFAESSRIDIFSTVDDDGLIFFVLNMV